MSYFWVIRKKIPASFHPLGSDSAYILYNRLYTIIAKTSREIYLPHGNTAVSMLNKVTHIFHPKKVLLFKII